MSTPHCQGRVVFALAIHNPSDHTQVTFANCIDVGSAPPTRELQIDTESPCAAKTLTINDAAMLALHLRIERHSKRPNRAMLLTFDEICVRGVHVEQASEIDVCLPVQMRIGNTSVHLFEVDKRDCFEGALATLDSPHTLNSNSPVTFDMIGKPPSAATLNDWFRALGNLQRQPTGSREFFNVAAESVVAPGGLDAGMVLLRDDAGWKIQCSCIPNAPIGITFHPSLLGEMVRMKKTVFHSAELLNEDRIESPAPIRIVESIVAAPLFDDEGEIVGAVYGVRNTQSKNQRSGIRTLEAQWIQLVADAVSSGIVRLKAESDAARTRVLFEQAFTPEIAAELEHNPRILRGQEREISVLFADLRGFTSISEQLGSKQTFRLLADVMNILTDAIQETHGVVIDYYGDGLCAMWNAPSSQPDHALLACRTALLMQQWLPRIENKWRAHLTQSLRLGIGVNTGKAQVGNSGSRTRVKYGPRGTMVNIASRLEATTKSLSVTGDGILISSETARQATGIATREVNKLRLEGVEKAVNAFWLDSVPSTAPRSDLESSDPTHSVQP